MAAAASPSAASFKHLKEIVPNSVWMFSTPFKFLAGLLPINNNGLIIKAKKTSGESVLIAANAPELSAGLVQEIRSIEELAGGKVEYVLGTDWHHMFTKSWAAVFPTAEVLFSGSRGWRQHENEPFQKRVVDREHPHIPGIDESTCRLVPWLGFDGVKIAHPDEQRRGEFSVFLPEHKLLFIFDIFIPSIPFRKMIGMHLEPPTEDQMPTPRSNFGGRLSGFRIADPKLCADSAKALLALDIETVCFSHGDVEFGAVRRGKASVQSALQDLKSLIPHDR